MRALLDSSGYAALMRGEAEFVEILGQVSELCVPTIVLGELHSAFRRGNRSAENERLLRAFLRKPTVRVVDVTAETAERYAEVDVYLWSKGRPIPRNDVWIAALAFEHGCVLIARDAHFRELPLLPIRP